MSLFEVKHTFVVLAHGKSVHLQECIESLLNQSIPSRIHITTSTPNSYIDKIAAKYSLNIIVNHTGGTIGKDWNFGLQSAQTDFVTLAHQDDVYLPRFAELGTSLLHQFASSRPLLVFNKSIIYNRGVEVKLSYKNMIRGLLIAPFHFRKCITSNFTKKLITRFANPISCPGVMYNRKNLGEFRFDETERYVLDWRAWYQLSETKGAFVYATEPMHIHREHEESATSSTDIAILQQEEFDLLKSIWGNYTIARVITAFLRLTK